MTDLERELEAVGGADHLAVLALADMLEEEGRWEEAAVLRLHRPAEGASTRHVVPRKGVVWAGLGRRLEVNPLVVPEQDQWWVWRPGTGWRRVYSPGGPGLWEEPPPAGLRGMVEEAVRLAGCKRGTGHD